MTAMTLAADRFKEDVELLSPIHGQPPEEIVNRLYSSFLKMTDQERQEMRRDNPLRHWLAFQPMTDVSEAGFQPPNEVKVALPEGPHP